MENELALSVQVWSLHCCCPSAANKTRF